MTDLHRILDAKVKQSIIDLSVPRKPCYWIGKAVTSQFPARPNKLLNITIGAIAGIFLGAIAGGMAVLFMHQLRKRSGNALVKSS